MATTFHRVRSSHPEDDALGRVFGPGELVPDLDTEDPFNQRKVEEGIFYPVDDKGVDVAVEEQSGQEVTPAAAKLAAANNIDLSTVNGTGQDGAIKREDVQKVLDDLAVARGENDTEGAAENASTGQ